MRMNGQGSISIAVIFSFSVCVVATALLGGCGVAAKQANKIADLHRHEGSIGRYGRPTDTEMRWAKVAWRYFENNTNPENGLVNSFDRYPVFSMAHLADYLAALAAARSFQLIDVHEFDQRLSRVLKFLNTMELSQGSVPAKLYNAMTGKMVNYSNQPEDIGWSALEIGRLMTWLKIIGMRYPQYQEYVDKAVLRWNFCRVVDDCGVMHGTSRGKEGFDRYQEGRLGEEQSAAAGYAAWGFDARRIWSSARVETVTILGMPVQYDSRDPRVTGGQAPVVTMPHVLLGMEYGWRYPGEGARLDLREWAEQVYRVQEARHARQGILTARTDYQVRTAPYQVIDAVFAAGHPWNTIDGSGKQHERLALVSTRAAFGMWVLWQTPYTDRLMQSVQSLYHPERGWYEGRLEATGEALESLSLSTNAMVLETLLFKAYGQLYPDEARPGYFQYRTSDVFRRPGQCLPSERPMCQAPSR
jgi:hypothetical protein